MEISNSEDCIDSRQIIKRIEELENQKCDRYVSGTINNGVVDEEEYDWEEDARTDLAAKIRIYSYDLAENDEDAAQELYDHSCEIEKGVGDITKYEKYGITYYLRQDGFTGLDEDELKELNSLVQIQEEAEKYNCDWLHGATLINESYFADYTKEFVEETSNVDLNSWPFNNINWKDAADELKQDYTEIDFNGTTYYIRCT